MAYRGLSFIYRVPLQRIDSGSSCAYTERVNIVTFYFASVDIPFQVLHSLSLSLSLSFSLFIFDGVRGR